MRLLLSLIVLLTACTPDSEIDVDDANTNDERPNILLIVADDMGYSDIGAYGGEIATPNLDDLAANGLTLTNFYTGPTCSVTRAMLISGQDNHIAGLGNMAETLADNQLGLPGYEGHLNDRVETIAEVLKSAGYQTYMAGKWHLGMQPEQSPHRRGFDQTFALLYGGASHFADMTGPDKHRDPALYRENGQLVSELPEDFFSTTFYTDRTISQIDSGIDSGKPFFAFLSYTAPHWPLQVPDYYRDKYQGRYDAGYDAIRSQRLAQQKRLGLLPETLVEPPRPGNIEAWEELDPEMREFHARNMELYAAMVDHMDMSIGRVIEFLDDRGELDNTIIVFMSDNGADPWDYDHSPPAVGQYAKTFDNSPENRGRAGSFVFYGAQWAHVSNTPFTRYKGSSYQGGIRSPLIVHWPARAPAGRVSAALTYVTDLFPTFTDAAGAEATASPGRSLVPLVLGKTGHIRDDSETIGLEVWGKRGVVGQRYKLVSSPKKPHGQADWELYDLWVDPSEQRNLAAEQPEVLARMLQAWESYQAQYNVVLPEGEFKVRPVGEIPAE